MNAACTARASQQHEAPSRSPQTLRAAGGARNTRLVRHPSDARPQQLNARPKEIKDSLKLLSFLLRGRSRRLLYYFSGGPKRPLFPAHAASTESRQLAGCASVRKSCARGQRRSVALFLRGESPETRTREPGEPHASAARRASWPHRRHTGAPEASLHISAATRSRSPGCQTTLIIPSAPPVASGQLSEHRFFEQLPHAG